MGGASAEGAGRARAALWPAEGDVAVVDQAAERLRWDLRAEPLSFSRYGGVLERACSRAVCAVYFGTLYVPSPTTPFGPLQPDQ